MGLFQRCIKRSRQRVWARGPGPRLPVSSGDEAIMADEAGPPADQHRVRHSGRIVDRTRDLSTVRDGETKPVLDPRQEDDSNAGMSNDYVGNSYVRSVLADVSDPGVTSNSQDLQNGLLHSDVLESDPRVVKSDIQISEPQSYKAQKTESENEQVELDAGEETGLPRGNRAGPVADILLPDNQPQIDRPPRAHQKQSKEAVFQSSPADISADEMLFNQGVLPNKTAPEKEKENTRSMEPAWDHPDIPAGVRGALEKIQADFTGQPNARADSTKAPPKEQTQTVSIGRVSVRLKPPEATPPVQKPATAFGAEKTASRYFMGDA